MKFTFKKSMEIAVLVDSGSVQKKIKKVFDSTRKKVAVVAFVGQDAEIYLGNNSSPATIYCWPKAGGTNPYAIQDLIKNCGCKVNFADKLHMKIFWSSDCGCVIGSANLTNNALGEGGLKEAGVYFPDSSKVDIEKIIGGINARPVTNKELAELIDAHKKYYAKNGAKGLNARKQRSFLDWYASHSREDWKLGWWTEQSGFSEAAIEIAKKEYALKTPWNFINGKKGNFAPNDWILFYRITDNGIISPGSINWLYAQQVVRTDEDKDWPEEAIQFQKTGHFTRPPFIISSKFRKVFKKVGESLGKGPMMPAKKSCFPPGILVDKLAKALCK